MKQGLEFLAAVAILALLGLGGWHLLFGGQDATLVVAEAAEAVLEDGQGLTQPVSVGTTVSVGERLRTSEGGFAVLGQGDTSFRIEGGRGSVVIDALDESGMQVSFEGGKLSARVRNGSPSLRVSRGQQGVFATDADFALAADAEGGLAVQGTRGEVDLAGFGVDTLKQGRQVRINTQGDASEMAIPEALLLEVAWPDETVTREERTWVRGSTEPHMVVRVSGPDGDHLVRADEHGVFEAQVRLKEGNNTLQVEVSDALSGGDAQQHQLERKTTGPTADVGVEYR